jgi:hypothetical protein
MTTKKSYSRFSENCEPSLRDFPRVSGGSRRHLALVDGKARRRGM